MTAIRPASLSARRAWIEIHSGLPTRCCNRVALRKESVDRNMEIITADSKEEMSLSARRAWIEILNDWLYRCVGKGVALRKESVDRNMDLTDEEALAIRSLSARRAWIEIKGGRHAGPLPHRRSPQGERG